MKLQHKQLRLLTLLVSAIVLSGSQDQLSAQSPKIRFMTYNVRYASNRSPNAWKDRIPSAKAMLEKYQPDVIGMQEALYRQVKDFRAMLPDHDWIGLGRDGGSRGEFMAVFYRRDRFEPVEFDHFWLSDTPNVVASSTWGNSNRRMVTWVLFRDKRSGKRFYFWNTHFDHAKQVAREKSAKLVNERVAKLATDLPLILAGDFNAVAESNVVYKTLVDDGGFTDTWKSADKRGELVGTFNGFRGKPRSQARIDWILTKGKVKCHSSEIVTFQKDGQYPSDHFPVIADIELTEDN